MPRQQAPTCMQNTVQQMERGLTLVYLFGASVTTIDESGLFCLPKVDTSSVERAGGRTF